MGKYSETTVLAYYNSVIKRVHDALAVSSLPAPAKLYLNKGKIKKIICSEPNKLKKFHASIIPKLGAGFSIAEYNLYLEAKESKKWKRPLTGAQYNLLIKYGDAIKELEKVFNYNKFISKSKKTAYDLAKIHNRNTCTYCNRLYTNLVFKKNPFKSSVNNADRLVRPHFDHWFSKKRYPVLALSFYNLIPSCYVCNSTIKGDADFNLSTHVNPFLGFDGDTFTFTYSKKDVYENNIILNYRKGTKLARTLEDFHLMDIYNAHSEFELKDLLELSYKYSENYLELLFKEILKTPFTKLEAYRMVFGVEYIESDFHKRPFSKFKKDILSELGIKLE